MVCFVCLLFPIPPMLWSDLMDALIAQQSKLDSGDSVLFTDLHLRLTCSDMFAAGTICFRVVDVANTRARRAR